jgi:hypothetical protein
MFNVTASVGLTTPRSIWLSIARLTPQAAERVVSDQPFCWRSRLTRFDRWAATISEEAERVPFRFLALAMYQF